MFWLSPPLALVVVASVPVTVLVTAQVMKRSQARFADMWRTTGELNGQVEEAFTGHSLVKVFGRQREVEAVFGEGTSRSAHPKDAVDRAVVHGDPALLATDGRGTKVALRYRFDAVGPGETVRVRLRLHDDAWVDGVPEGDPLGDPFGAGFDEVLAARRAEADSFYASVIPEHVSIEISGKSNVT